MCLCIDRLAIERGIALTFDVGEEITMRATGNHGHLQTGLAQGGQRLLQLQQLAGIGAVEQLNRRHRQSTGATGCANMAARLAFRRHQG